MYPPPLKIYYYTSSPTFIKTYLFVAAGYDREERAINASITYSSSGETPILMLLPGQRGKSPHLEKNRIKQEILVVCGVDHFVLAFLVNWKCCSVKIQFCLVKIQ